MSTPIFVIVIFVILSIFMNSLKVVKKDRRLVVYRLGKFLKVLSPGFAFCLPIIDQPVWVDINERNIDLPELFCVTKDGANIGVKLSIRIRIVDPAKAVLDGGMPFKSTGEVLSSMLKEKALQNTFEELKQNPALLSSDLLLDLNFRFKNLGVNLSSIAVTEIQQGPSSVI